MAGLVNMVNSLSSLGAAKRDIVQNRTGGLWESSTNVEVLCMCKDNMDLKWLLHR